MKRKSTKISILITSIAGIIFLSTNPVFGDLMGTVTFEGKPAPGAQVTARHRDSGIAVSVFANSDGRYRLVPVVAGNGEISATWSETASNPSAITLEIGGALTQDIVLARDPESLARVTSAEWLSLLPDGEMKREFILNCASCHELHTDRVMVDGKLRDKAQWTAAFEKMRAIDQYNILPSDFKDAKYIDWLVAHLTNDALATLKPSLPDNPDSLAAFRITEYPLPEAMELPHDLVVGPHGKIWITAFFTDVIWALNPADGSIDTYQLRDGDAEGWGQARALVFDRDGGLWVVLGGTHQLVRLEPATREFRTYDIGFYAHSIALDDDGRIWFNDYFAKEERIGVFDPSTEKVTHMNIPSAGLTAAQGLPLPYGLQIDSQGRLYSTQLAANSVVAYDTRSNEAELLMMPAENVAPRRPAIGGDDRLWIPEWNTGYLTSFDPNTRLFKRYSLGDSALGAYDAEYDALTKQVWVTGALASSMVLFDPKSGSALEVPLPTNPAYTRHLAVDPVRGDLWSAYSSLPAAEPKVVRIERQ